jgi:hypothetical protein
MHNLLEIILVPTLTAMIVGAISADNKTLTKVVGLLGSFAT